MKTDSLGLPSSKWNYVPAFFISVIITVLIGAALYIYIGNSGLYPRGSDIYGHLFRSNLMYESIKAGNLFPVYTDFWYNGFQPFRYSAPLSYYFVGGLQFITGNTMSAYLLFVPAAFVLGALGWLLFGLKTKRMVLCTIIGCLWFFIPDNARVFFSEGNLPRMMANIFLPYFFYFLWQFLEQGKKRNLIMAVIFTSLISLSHLMVGALLGIGTSVFLLIYAMVNHKWRRPFYLIGAMLSGLAMIGFWLYPALKGGIMQVDSSSIASYMTQKAIITLNPFARMYEGWDTFYYGSSILFISLMGVLLSNRKSFPGFLTPILFFFGTTTALLPIIIKLPLGELMWMMRFVPIVTAVFFISLIEWRKCRKLVIFFFCMLLIADSASSLHFINASGQEIKTSEQHQKEFAEPYGLVPAKEMTEQRLAFVDGDRTGSYPSYGICAVEPKTKYAFGWNYQAATTGFNLMELNTALQTGAFLYLFDRAIEMGNDTVIVRKDALPKLEGIADSLKESASKLQYVLMETTEKSYIYHRQTPSNFGVVTTYGGLTIGASATQISLAYPYYGRGKSDNLSDYTYDELKDYKKLYLSGFTYTEKDEAQSLITRLANHGVSIYIDMNRIPEDPQTKRMTFLDVEAQPVTFIAQFPALIYNNRQYNPDLFKADYNSWNTVFLDNVPHAYGYSYFNKKKLVFYGTGKNQNIKFLGFNLLYHAMEARDQKVFSLLDEILDLNGNLLPQRELVPIKITNKPDGIVINSPADHLNTTLAYLDLFKSKRELHHYDNLLIVDKGETVIHFNYPYLVQGIILTVIGFLGLILLLMRYAKGERKLKNKKEKEKLSQPLQNRGGLDELDVYFSLDPID